MYIYMCLCICTLAYKQLYLYTCIHILRINKRIYADIVHTYRER